MNRRLRPRGLERLAAALAIPLSVSLALLPPLEALAQLPEAPEAPKVPEPKAPEAPAELPPPEALPAARPPPPRAAPHDAPWLPPELGGKASSGGGVEEIDDRRPLTIQEIVDSLVLTASNRAESSRTAPAWIITITREEILQRGYRELTEILDDLPSMDVVRPWGDTYFKNYWRGYRNTIGSPYLLMLDGIIYNHLWLNEATIMAAFPIANIERVEVVYGPASAVYGPNAVMGVINVITRRQSRGDEPRATARLTAESPQANLGNFSAITKTADLGVLYPLGPVTFQVAARFDVGVLDTSIADQFEWTKNAYSTDRRLWGDFLDYPNIAGSFYSPSEKQALDARVYLGGTELGVQHFRLLNGQGAAYASDRIPNRFPYTLLEQSAYLRHQQALGRKVFSTTLLRYRRSNVDPPSPYLERVSERDALAARDRAAETGDPDDLAYAQSIAARAGHITYQYWESRSSSFIMSQDLAIELGRRVFLDDDLLLADVGFRYERRDLERAYVISGADQYWDPGQFFNRADGTRAYNFPDPPTSADRLDNRNSVDVVGLYLFGRYSFSPAHHLNLGGRMDYNAMLDRLEVIVRGGYVGQLFERLTFKLLYGQALQEPTWRELFGTWSGLGANPGLRSERSHTLEASLAYNLDWLAVQGNGYFVHFSDAISSAGENIGKRSVVGGDLSVTALPFDFARQFRVWAYYSAYLYAKQTPLGAPEGSEQVDIGDLAPHKLLAGMSLELNRNLGVTLLGRFIAERTTVATNPLGSVPAYVTSDVHVWARDVPAPGFGFGLRILNWPGVRYAHPGIGTADSGNTPGVWEAGRFLGSQGYFNSLLPQPGRTFSLYLNVDM